MAGGWGGGGGARRAWTGGRLIGEAGTMREWSLNARPLTTVVTRAQFFVTVVALSMQALVGYSM